jgi:hypothetical protein
MAADDTITEILRTAHESVSAAGIPEALQSLALEKAIDLAAMQHGLVSAPTTAAAGPTSPPSSGTPPPAGATTEKSVARIAAQLDMSVETVDEVYHLDADALSLSIATGKLPSANKAAVKEIALLIAGGRQAGGWDTEWTAASEIRPVADAYGKFDGNFASSLTEMEDELSFNGSGSGRKVKLKRKGKEDLVALVKRLAGEE